VASEINKTPLLFDTSSGSQTRHRVVEGLGIPASWMLGTEDYDYASTAILVVGNGSNCGQFVMQLAKLAGSA